MTELTAGHLIAGRYRLVQRLGQGGMGSVWSAEHLELRSRVAIKLIVPKYANDPDMLSRFVREARAAAALRSPHVVQIFDSGIDEGLAFIAMEQLEGESLAERLDREDTLSPKLTATVVTHVARAITRAHESNLVHRDLKPENIFLVQNEDELVAKVLDFGIAKVLAGEDGEPPSTRTETGRLVGSPYYMSPEQARGRDVDFRSDLWALGVLAYECLLGKRPFTGISLGEIILAICTEPVPVPSANGTVPNGFDAWFARATARDREQRFQSARELAAALRSSLSPDSAPAPSDAVDGSTSGSTSGANAITPRGRSAEATSMGTTTGEPTSSDAKPAQPAKPKTLRSWPVVAAVAAAAAVAAVLGLRPRTAPSVEPTPTTEHAAQASPAEVPAPVVLPTSALPSTSALAAPSAAPAVSVSAAPSATPAVRSRAEGAARPRPAKTIVPVVPSAPANVVKDPLTSRF